MDQDKVSQAPPVTTENNNPIIARTIHTTVLTIEIKYILEITDNLYADGVEKQDRHDRAETRISLDRDSYVETPTGTI